MPKITITNVPTDMTDEARVTKICEEDVFLNSEINNEAIFSVIKSWASKRYNGTPNLKNGMIRYSPQIRKTYHER